MQTFPRSKHSHPAWFETGQLIPNAVEFAATLSYAGQTRHSTIFASLPHSKRTANWMMRWQLQRRGLAVLMSRRTSRFWNE